MNMACPRRSGKRTLLLSSGYAPFYYDLFAVRRQVRDAERDIEVSIRRIGEIARILRAGSETAGDAFAMTVRGVSYDGRKDAGRALLKEILTVVQLRPEG